MKKYIFTESQIKKVIDGVINEQSMGSNKQTATIPNMQFTNVKPDLIDIIKTKGVFKVIQGTDVGTGILLNNKPVQIGMDVTKQTIITVPMSSFLILSGMGLPKASIEYNNNGLVFNGYVA
jgi:hypothetical protein